MQTEGIQCILDDFAEQIGDNASFVAMCDAHVAHIIHGISCYALLDEIEVQRNSQTQLRHLLRTRLINSFAQIIEKAEAAIDSLEDCT